MVPGGGGGARGGRAGAAGGRAVRGGRRRWRQAQGAAEGAAGARRVHRPPTPRPPRPFTRRYGGADPRHQQAAGRVQHGGGRHHPAAADRGGGHAGEAGRAGGAAVPRPEGELGVSIALPPPRSRGCLRQGHGGTRRARAGGAPSVSAFPPPALGGSAASAPAALGAPRAPPARPWAPLRSAWRGPGALRGCGQGRCPRTPWLRPAPRGCGRCRGPGERQPPRCVSVTAIAPGSWLPFFGSGRAAGAEQKGCGSGTASCGRGWLPFPFPRVLVPFGLLVFAGDGEWR